MSVRQGKVEGHDPTEDGEAELSWWRSRGYIEGGHVARRFGDIRLE